MTTKPVHPRHSLAGSSTTAAAAEGTRFENRNFTENNFFNFPELDINIADLHPGKPVQVDGGFSNFEPLGIYTVQATDDGRLFIADENREPFFFDEWIEETGGMEDTGGALQCICDPADVREFLKTRAA